MKTVVCCSVMVRGHHGRRMNAEWVRKLHEAMDKNLPHDGRRVRHVCLTDDPDAVHRVAGPMVVPIDISAWWNKYRDYKDGLYDPIGGWWAKVKLFDPGLIGSHDEVALYCDLDALITGSLEPLLSFPHYLRICPDTAANKTPKPGVYRGFNSSVMSWCPGEFANVYTGFGFDVLDGWRSDQDWIKCRVDADRVVTYDADRIQRVSECGHDGPKPGTSVVLCIKPKNDQAAQQFEWVRKLWR